MLLLHQCSQLPSLVIIEADSSTGFTLEWCWPFESGNDEYDTLLGIDNGDYHIVVSIIAQFEGE